MSSAITKPFTVTEPFDFDPDADLIIQSSDKLEFRVRKAILSLASPVFKDMFSFPQPVTDDSTILHTVELPDSGIIIDSLLRYCYPVDPPLHTDDFNTLVAILSASEKYDMEFITTKVHDHIKWIYANDPRYAMLRYRHAFECRQAAETRLRAWDCLRFPLPSLVEDREITSTDSALSTLVVYHHAVSSRIVEFLTNIKDIGSCTEWNYWGVCQPCSSVTGMTYDPSWWRSDLVSTISKVYRGGPTSGHILPDGLCKTCGKRLTKTWNMFEYEFNRLVGEEARKVRFAQATALFRQLHSFITQQVQLHIPSSWQP